MNPVETKRAIVAALSAFAAQPLAAAATGLFESLGYPAIISRLMEWSRRNDKILRR